MTNYSIKIYRSFFILCILLEPFMVMGMQSSSNSSVIIAAADLKELDELAARYKQGIDIIGVPGLGIAKLTRKSLNHVFNIEVKKDSKKNTALHGFHHDYQFKLEEKNLPFHSSFTTSANGVGEAYIAFRRKDIPVYKTFFPIKLSKQEVLDLLAISLRNIQEYEKQENHRLSIIGNTHAGFSIQTIIDRSTGEIVTFYPLSETSEETITARTRELRSLFKKFFHTIPNKPVRTPITEKEAINLSKQFSPKIPFSKALCQIDPVSPAMRKQFPFPINFPLSNVLIDQNKLKNLQKKYPGRIRVEKVLETVHFTPEVILEMFSEKNNANFPPHLTYEEILKHVPEALNNITGFYGGLFSKVQMGNLVTEKDLSDLPTYRQSENTIYIHGNVKRTGNTDSFSYQIEINKDTGNITGFFPRFA